MGIISRCICDPYKLTYVSAIVTSVEAVACAVLNIVFLCMYKCLITLPDNVSLGFDKFWAFYFFDKDECIAQGETNETLPWWTRYSFPLDDADRSLTTPYDNFVYQSTYLGLHTAWLLTAILLIYGNARKLWGYYLPWLLVSTAIAVMDVTISAFCITDLVTVDAEGYTSAMFWILVLYFRLFIFWFVNLSEYASAFNAFCKSRHKRAKQERHRQKMAKAHAQELARAEAATEARVRAQMAEQQLQQQQQQQQQQQHQQQQHAWDQNVQPRRKIPPPVPKKPAAPPELRPFSYLNPAFRPNDPTDVEGMRTHPTPALAIPVRPLKIPPPEGSYFPADGYDRPKNIEGFPRRHDSMRSYHTQEPHPALRRFSSIRAHPSYPSSGPLEPLPDYDFTLKRGPSSSNQSEYKWQSYRVSRSGGGGGYKSLSLPVMASSGRDPGTPYPSTFIHASHPSAHTSAVIPSTFTPHPHQASLRHGSLTDILSPHTPNHPSPIFYTTTAARTHLQIYTSSSDAEGDSQSLQGAQNGKLIFGGVFVPSYCRKVTSYISSNLVKTEGGEREELPAAFWDAQWRSMRKWRANLFQRQISQVTDGSLPRTLYGSDRKQTHVSNNDPWEIYSTENNDNTAHSKDLISMSTKGSLALLNSEETAKPLRPRVGSEDGEAKAIIVGSNMLTVNSLHHDTVDLSRAPKNEISSTSKYGASNKRTVVARSTESNRAKRRKLSETYITVSLKRESYHSAFPRPSRPQSVSSEDLLPSNPAIPIMQRAVRLHAH